MHLLTFTFINNNTIFFCIINNHLPNFRFLQNHLGVVWILTFPSLITQFSLLIIQKWWDPHRCSLFGFVFKFCFHHSTLTFLSNEIQKLKTSFMFFCVMKTELWWNICNFVELSSPTHMLSPLRCCPANGYSTIHSQPPLLLFPKDDIAL